MRYVVVTLATAAAAALVYFSLAFGLSPAPITAEYWVREMMVVKRDIARRHSGEHKIIIASGSGTLFSIDTGMLARELGVPVVNYGLHAGLALETLLGEVEPAALPGDIVILPLEPSYYCEQGPTEWQIRNAIAWDPGRWAAMSMRERADGIRMLGPLGVAELVKVRLLLLRSPQSLAKRLAALDDAGVLARFAAAPEPQGFEYSAYHLDALGNLLGTEGNLKMAKPRPPTMPTHVCATTRTELLGFVERATARNIKVYFANQPYVDTGTIDRSAMRDAAAQFLKELTPIGCMLDDREDLIMDRRLFFNSDQHLNAEGREVRTRRLLLKLQGLRESGLSSQIPCRE